MRKRSRRPSWSKSIQAAPEPIVSENKYCPLVETWCTKSRPAAAVALANQGPVDGAEAAVCFGARSELGPVGPHPARSRLVSAAKPPMTVRASTPQASGLRRPAQAQAGVSSASLDLAGFSARLRRSGPGLGIFDAIEALWAVGGVWIGEREH